MLADLRRIAAARRAPAYGPPGAGSAGISRRELLVRGGALGGAALLAAPGASLARRGGARDERVVIVGAGLAGLTCAYRLARRGVRATVFEASERVGGRCWTARGWADGQVAEHGGEFVDTRHVRLRRLARELGVGLEDRVAAEDAQDGEPHSVLWLEGAQRNSDAIFRPFAGVLERLEADARRIGSYRAGRARRAAREFDAMSVADWLHLNVPGGSRSLLARAISSTQVSLFGLDPERLSAINLIETFVTPYEGADERYHLHGGSDRVVTRLAARLPRGSVRRGTPLLGLRRLSGGGYRLRFAGVRGEVAADRVVLALPFPALRRTDLRGAGIGAEHMRAIEQLGMGTNAKLLLQFDARPVAYGGWSGEASLDSPPTATWESSLTQPGRSGLLTVFTGGRAGTAYPGSRSHVRAPASVVSAELRRLERFAPGISRGYSGRAWLDVWVRDRWTRGSYAAFMPGQYTRWWGALGRREGGLHFAGEHTSTHSQGYMDGGVESGERAAREVLRALGR